MQKQSSTCNSMSEAPSLNLIMICTDPKTAHYHVKKNNLHIDGGILVPCLKRAMMDKREFIIQMYQIEDKVIGVGLVTPENLVNVFVDKNYRKKGVASALVDSLKKSAGFRQYDFWAICGESDECSEKFWKKNAVSYGYEMSSYGIKKSAKHKSATSIVYEKLDFNFID